VTYENFLLEEVVMGKLVAGIEAGGTKFVCAVGSGPDDIRARVVFPTTTPDETLGQVVAFLGEHPEIEAVGIGTFGPADPNPASPTFGYITTTPKPHWANVYFAGIIQRATNVPVGFDTDVNIAGLGEWQWGAAQGLDTFVYLTIGTGIGGGGMANGKLMHGLLHPEMGHIRLPRGDDAGEFAGICPYHGDCLEGLASGPAIKARWGVAGGDLPVDHPAWQIEAHYLALALSNYVCTLSPQRIILGGGVMGQAQLFPLIRQEVLRLLNGYVGVKQILEGIDDYIVPPALGGNAGILGAIALAQRQITE
jgi:fructokinase